MIKVLNIVAEYDLYRIFLDNNTTLLVDDDDVIKYQILSKKVLTPAANTALALKNNYYQCYCAALKLLGVKMLSTKELAHKLRYKKYETETINQVIAQLVVRNYLNDDILRDDYIEFKINQGYGPQYIKNKLYQLGLDSHITISLEQQKEALQNFFLRSSYKINDAKAFQKIATKLCRQGFAYDLIVEVYEEYKGKDD